MGFSHEKLYQKALFFGSHGDYIVIEFRCLLRMTTQKAIVYVDSMFKGKTNWLEILRLQSKFNSRIKKLLLINDPCESLTKASFRGHQ